MTGMQSEIEINRPVETVYGFFLDLEESITRTDPTVESVVKTSQGLLAAGTTFRIRATKTKSAAPGITPGRPATPKRPGWGRTR